MASASVPLDSPATASPTTGSTGAPHPMTLHGPVDRPSIAAAAPRLPPLPADPAAHPRIGPRRRLSRHKANQAPTRPEVARMRARSRTSTAKPHSVPPYGLSAENQNRARLERRASFGPRGPGEARYSGTRASHGLNVM